MKAKKYLVSALTLALCGGIAISARPSAFADKEFTEKSAELIKQTGRDTLAGLEGVMVSVEFLEPEVEKYGLTRQILQTDTELRLRRNGIRIVSEEELKQALGGPILVIEVLTTTVKEINLAAVSMRVELRQNVMLKRDPTIVCFADTWREKSVMLIGLKKLKNIRESVQDMVDVFINDYLTVNPKDEQMITGTVRYLNFEGGFYGIVADNGEKYDPVNLPKEYKKDGLRVMFRVKEKKGMMGFHMWGRIVEVVKIERL